MLTDSHAHLDMVPPEELPGVLARAHAAGVGTILAIGIGDGPASMHRALEIALAASGPDLPRVYASAGMHPQEAHQADAAALMRLDTLARQPRCLAVGEIGLDYYHADNPDVATQQAAFVAQLAVAATLRKPILIHCRTSELATAQAKQRYGAADAWKDLHSLLTEHWKPSGLAGIMHCFSGSVEQARRSLDLGFCLSFAGNLTYPAGKGIREAAAFAPADRILVETDAPFLAPIPHRGKTNEPAFVTHTAAALAEVRGVSPATVAALTTENFARLFPSTVAPDKGQPPTALY